jgi:SAM-dependent methyltransferase
VTAVFVGTYTVFTPIAIIGPASKRQATTAESAYETESLTLSTDDVMEEHGREYHLYGPGLYDYPGDAPECNRLKKLFSALCILMNNSLHISLLENPLEVLELGTGTGSWAMEFAKRNPTAFVTGLDLSPVQTRRPIQELQFHHLGLHRQRSPLVFGTRVPALRFHLPSCSSGFHKRSDETLCSSPRTPERCRYY